MNKINQGIILFKMNRSLLSDYFLQNSSICSFRSSDSWVVLSPIELSIKQKIEAIGTPLKDWDIQINYGIKTGFNEAFIIDGEKRAELIEADPKCAEIIRPILRGRDIKRYNYEFADLWLINTHNGIKEKGISRIDIDDYPTIKAHLDQYWDQISTRADKGDTPYNLRNCAYMDDFNKQKIVWAETMRIKRGNDERFPRFTWTDCDILTDKTCFFATGNNLKYIVGVLNSIIGRYQCKNVVSILDNGGYLMQKIFIEKIIIPNANTLDILNIERLVDILLQADIKMAEREKCELELDILICNLFHLTQNEYQFILRGIE